MNLNQVTIPSLNVSSAILFYKKLGLELIVESLPNYARFVCPNGESTFSIHLVDNIINNSGTYIYFECDDLDKKVKDLVSNGIVFDEMPNDKSWLWREARLKDLDKNQIILFYAGENRLNPPWKIKN